LFFTGRLFGGSNPAQVNVQTTAQTTYQGFNPDSFSGLTANSMVSVSGWLFPPASSTAPPTLAAETVILRSNGLF
jgi:hypothetical protein